MQQNWKLAEDSAYDWFQANIDPNAVQCGGENANTPDIYSPLYGSYVEVKDITNGARCGQFTEGTITNNPFSSDIYNGNYSAETCCNFVKYHYSQKNVTHFIIIDGDSLTLYDFDTFFENYTFDLQAPYRKRSGTRQAPKKDIPHLLKINTNFVLSENGRVYCTDPNRWGTYLITPMGDYFISKNNQGELRKQSNTFNMTWHLLIHKHTL